ncbi:nuclear transport factor 2 family protein [Spirosoma linguale]|uniref:SnoaL-like domain-containing protein n=1 Tax=Spirosoma linguale (strain ATCC 33905 / DSM 74 / LMG 10896 / Claus 1) TaxID=504472 RepID=D2QKG8_SPILD|nr:hypothetical protein Slin_2982 [Spirosoma linguale DSM 74]
MKTTCRLPIVIAFFVASLSFVSCQKQEEQAKEGIKKYVTITDSADIYAKVLTDFVGALTAADWEKTRSLAASNFKSYGPAMADSSGIDSLIAGWQRNHALYSNIKLVSAVPMGFSSTAPRTTGNWGFQWGVYSMTYKATGKTITFPYHLTARVENGKIQRLGNYWDRSQFIGPMGNKVVKAELSAGK